MWVCSQGEPAALAPRSDWHRAGGVEVGPSAGAGAAELACRSWLLSLLGRLVGASGIQVWLTTPCLGPPGPWGAEWEVEEGTTLPGGRCALSTGRPFKASQNLRGWLWLRLGGRGKKLTLRPDCVPGLGGGDLDLRLGPSFFFLEREPGSARQPARQRQGHKDSFPSRLESPSEAARRKGVTRSSCSPPGPWPSQQAAGSRGTSLGSPVPGGTTQAGVCPQGHVLGSPRTRLASSLGIWGQGSS